MKNNNNGKIKLRNRGFTFIELLITVTIISVLASISFPLTKLIVQREKEQQLQHNLFQIRAAIDAYKNAVNEGLIEVSIDESGYPESLNILVDGVININSPNNEVIYFLRRIPRDPFANNDLAAKETWGKRSYDSPPENPREGKDVFDIYSLSKDKGLNGILYREW